MVIVYLPWGDLDRAIANFYIVPFWANSPRWASAECFRFLCWWTFGKLSLRWKNLSEYSKLANIEQNLMALKELKTYSEKESIPLHFMWSPQRKVLNRSGPDLLAGDKDEVLALFPDRTVLLEPVFRKERNVNSLYVDDFHYSKMGHKVVGIWLADFLRRKLSKTHAGLKRSLVQPMPGGYMRLAIDDKCISDSPSLSSDRPAFLLTRLKVMSNGFKFKGIRPAYKK